MPKKPTIRSVLVRLDAKTIAGLDALSVQWQISREGVIRAALGEWLDLPSARVTNRKRQKKK